MSALWEEIQYNGSAKKQTRKTHFEHFPLVLGFRIFRYLIAFQKVYSSGGNALQSERPLRFHPILRYGTRIIHRSSMVDENTKTINRQRAKAANVSCIFSLAPTSSFSFFFKMVQEFKVGTSCLYLISQPFFY
jgi:hypothetical protein